VLHSGHDERITSRRSAIYNPTVRRTTLALAIAIHCLTLPLLAASPGELRAAARMKSARSNPQLLRRFLEAMPKGGDLHNHLSGAVYGESFLRFAAADKLCIDTQQLIIAARPPADCDSKPGLVEASKALTDAALNQQMLDAMSMRQFRPVAESGHDHFFRTFGKFGAVSSAHIGEMLTEVVSRLARENVDYLETIFGQDRGAARQLGKRLPAGWTFESGREFVLQNGAADIVRDSRKTLDEAEGQLRTTLHCGTTDAQQGCDSTVRYIYELHRGLPNEQFFAELVIGYELGSADPRVVAVNPVMAEDGPLPMSQFDEQMKMFAFFHQLYPKVHLTTHAGELAAGFVPPEGLQSHVRDSVMVAQAERIGHGVDIARERDSEGLLREMAKRPVAVEICLTSNDVILGVRGKDHPLPLYLKAGVPVMLATDDPGVSRGDLTTEFTRAATEFDLGYTTLKTLTRNSLQYSFLEGASLWFDGGKYTRFAGPCRDAVPGGKPTAACGTFLSASPKAMAQWKLEQRFREFER
jgi:adenosine deaminase